MFKLSAITYLRGSFRFGVTTPELHVSRPNSEYFESISKRFILAQAKTCSFEIIFITPKGRWPLPVRIMPLCGPRLYFLTLPGPRRAQSGTVTPWDGASAGVNGLRSRTGVPSKASRVFQFSGLLFNRTVIEVIRGEFLSGTIKRFGHCFPDDSLELSRRPDPQCSLL